jgi:hypothetical protein
MNDMPRKYDRAISILHAASAAREKVINEEICRYLGLGLRDMLFESLINATDYYYATADDEAFARRERAIAKLLRETPVLETVAEAQEVYLAAFTQWVEIHDQAGCIPHGATLQ